MSPGAEVTRLGATDLGAEMPGLALQGILGGVDVADTSATEYMPPTWVRMTQPRGRLQTAACGVQLLHAPLSLRTRVLACDLPSPRGRMTSILR